ncbi:MAG: glycosyltransferase family 2 protein [Lachnospiraceae bacterium]|nr:glycosyltransferase family 2 protein [Lachnospiraceae bacterium]
MYRSNELVTIIIPAWNVEKYIHRGIESCLNQSYCDIEVMVVDDGSTDETLKIAEKFAEEDRRVRVLSKEHCGVSAARNYGMKHAKGKCLMFLDSDDWLAGDAVEILMNYFTQYPEHLIGAKSIFVEEGKEDEDRKSSDEIIMPIVMGQHEALMNTDQTTYRNSSACYKIFYAPIIQDNDIRFDEDISIGEDGLFVFRYLNHVKGMVYVDAAVWRCLVRKGSSTRVPYDERFITALYAIERMMQYPNVKADDIEDMLKAFLVKKALDLFRKYIDCGNEDKKVVYYLKSYIKKYKKEYERTVDRGQRLRTNFILFMPFPIYLKLYRKKHHIY